ncbi:hypothetical protein M405DRAFT_842265 [Rhizopogon salebrosus TDB-379]|nr:hypothetical protein M405DRAFT_842265 [Rhizopogon salebrosus TDB-379]
MHHSRAVAPSATSVRESGNLLGVIGCYKLRLSELSTSASTTTSVMSHATGSSLLSHSTAFATAVLQPTAESPTTIVSPALITVTSGNAIVTTWIPQIITSTIPGSDSTNTTSNTGDIVGGIIGGIVAMCLLGLLLFFMRRRRGRDRLVLHPSGGGTFLHAELMGRSDIITPFPRPERGGVMRQYSDNPYLSAGAIGAGEGDRVARSPMSAPPCSPPAPAPSLAPNRI